MANCITKPFNMMRDWYVSYTEGPEAVFLHNPKMAKALKEHIKDIGKDTSNTRELLELADAFLSSIPQSTDALHIIERGLKIVKSGPKADNFFQKHYDESHLKNMELHAATALEKKHGVVSKRTEELAKKIMGTGQEDGTTAEQTGHDKIIALADTIKKAPSATLDGMPETIFRAADSIEQISSEETPLKENLVSLCNLFDDIDQIISQRFETSDTMAISYAAFSLEKDRDLIKDLASLTNNGAENLLSFREDQEMHVLKAKHASIYHLRVR